ncbi:hypothetical protein MRX96_024748 [Rhipicephalus microplus]
MDIKDLVFPDPRLDTMKAWTGGLGQLERFLESSCGRSTEPAPSDMFPGFPSSGSSQGMPGSAPLNPGAAANPWFHQSAFSMATDIHSGASGTASSSMAGSPYWLPPHQYAPTPAADPHQSRYSAGNDLYSASTSAGATPWWFGHNTSTAGSGLHSSQYFQQHVPRSDPMSNPFHTPQHVQSAPAQQRINHQSMMAPISSSSQMMAPPQSQPLNSIASGGLDTNIQPIFELYGHDPLASVQGGQQFHHQLPRFDVPAASSASGQGFTQLQSQTTWIPPEALSGADASKTKWAKPEAGGRRKKEESAKKKQKQDLLAEAKKGFQRKNIRDIKNESDLDEVTLNAQKEEQERMKRLQEARLRALQSQGIATGPAPPSAIAPIALESSSSSSDDSSSESEDEALPTVVPRRTGGDVIDISSSDEAKIPEEEDDDVVMVVSDGDDADDEKGDDLNDGAHINDAVNQPDSMGRVLVNVGHPPEDSDVFLAPQLAPIVKPHQIGGIRFLFDNVVESVSRFNTSSGFGCILAHSMGLGKTIQVISFVDVLLRHTAARKVLCITPHQHNPELARGIRQVGAGARGYSAEPSRAELILDWHKKGGVLLMGYEMYRMLALKKVVRPSKRRRSPKKEDLSAPEDESRHSQLLDDIYQAIVNPGPDLVICDEGHRIKNCNASTSTALKSIRTKRRIVLTGYPLQNNLLEYWCMVDFVRPSYLGTRSEFCNMFERPIQNGQCLDSTPKDRQLMRFRAHVLHSLLQGFVQRRGHAVLRDALPRKEEHVLLIRMTPIQRTLYREFVKEFLHNYRVTNPLKFFAVCCKVWNHPDILFHLVQDKKNEVGLDIDLDIDLIGPPAVKETHAKKHHHHHHHHTNAAAAWGRMAAWSGAWTPLGQPQDSPYNAYGANCDGTSTAVSGMSLNKPKYTQEQGVIAPFREKSDNNISYEWAYPLMEKYLPDMLDNSYKFLVLMTIVEQTLGVGDKLLVFSQSLSTLDLVERFLSRREVPLRPGLPHGEKWMRGKNYFRLDGSTSAQEREKLINEYNCNQMVSLFLLSTRAGCLGINLTGANRIVVLDASWNPCHDAQAVCRIYRYGQAKQCHIYRLVCDNCLEKRIYDRQVNKQGMSDRVVDEMNPEANLTWKDVSTLVQDNEDDPPVQDLSAVAGGFSDSVLRTLTMEYSHCLTKEPFEHESLLLDRKDLKLTKFEKRLAKQSYELEKRATLHGGRAYMHAANYSNGYQTWQNRQGTVTFLGPGPTQTTPSPMQPGSQNGDMPVWGTPNVMQSLLRQGMTVQRMRVPAKVTIPLNNSSDPPVEIPPGTEILVMKTPKGVYLRIPDGRIIAVRLPTTGEMAAAGQSGESLGGNAATTSAGNKKSFGIIQPSLQCGGRVQLSADAERRIGKGPPENGAIVPMSATVRAPVIDKPKEANGGATKPVPV